MSRILIPVDFTGCSKTAIDYALHIYDPSKYSFVLLHAYSSTRTSEFLVSIDDIIEKDIERKLEMERQHMIRIAGSENIEVELVMEKCELMDAIDKVLERTAIEMIVLCSEDGYSWAKTSSYNGLRTIDIVKNVNLPVLIVPMRKDLRHPKDVLFATRLDNAMNERDLAPLVEVLNNCHGHLDVISVVTSGSDKSEEKLRQSVNGFFKGLPVDLHSLEGSEVIDSILDFSDSHHSDLVCILYREHSFLENLFRGSVSEKMIGNLNWPLLALKHLG